MTRDENLELLLIELQDNEDYNEVYEDTSYYNSFKTLKQFMYESIEDMIVNTEEYDEEYVSSMTLNQLANYIDEFLCENGEWKEIK